MYEVVVMEHTFLVMWHAFRYAKELKHIVAAENLCKCSPACMYIQQQDLLLQITSALRSVLWGQWTLVISKDEKILHSIAFLGVLSAYIK